MSRADGPAGAGANGSSAEPSISADGRWVAFQSDATNLVLGVTEGVAHVYVRDLLSGTTRLVDRADGDGGAIANDDSFDPSIAVLGGQPVVAFSSVADNLSGATGGFVQVYVRQESLDDTTMVSRRDGSLMRTPTPRATAARPTRRSRPTARSSRSSPARRTSSPSTATRPTTCSPARARSR